MSPTFGENQSYFDSGRQKPETYQPSQDGEGNLSRSASRSQRPSQASIDPTPRQSVDQQREVLPQVRQIQKEENEGPQDSGIGSSPALTQQHDELQRELDQIKQKNAWYASELALARKSGYQTRSTDSPIMDERATDMFSEDDKPLIEALLKMRAELARVQETIDEQSKNAAERIAEMEKQRDSAISEAVFAKARLAGQGGAQEAQRGTPEGDRNGDLNKRLASSIATHNDLNGKIASLTRDIEMERKARQLAEETSDAAQKRVTELDSRHQEHSSELESLRAELHEAQATARDASANHAEILTQHKLLTVDKDEVHGKWQSALAETQNHGAILASLHTAVAASSEKAEMLERKLEEERTGRSGLEEKLRQLRAEHEERTAELETTSRRLRDAEEVAEKHSKEAETHRSVMLAGLGKVTERDVDPNHAAGERVTILQQQLESAHAMVRQNQAAADAASEKLRRAEERIAGLEAYQEQASREGLSIRKQMQTHMRDMQNLTTEKADLEQKLQSQMLETNALAVQHGALKGILGERGINASEVREARRSRAIDSPSSLNRFSTPDLSRVRDLEQQLEASLKSHDEMKTQFEEVSERDEKMKREYEEKLTALDNDHQAAVKYLRGTEKMLSKMKQELQRVKNENGDLRKKVDRIRGDGEGSKRGTPDIPADWEVERDKLKKEVETVQTSLKGSISELETKLAGMQTQLTSANTELEQSKSLHATSQADLSTLQATHTQTRSDIQRLQAENTQLEERARDAENKVQLLLDQVESSVDNYRRQSHLGGSTTPTANGTHGHARNLSGISTSTAGGAIGGGGHSRSQSEGAESMYSDATNDNTTAHSPSSADNNGRNSMALDSLASELETLRSHWETTNKNYRLSDKFDFERAGPKPGRMSEFSGSMVNWRKGLSDLEDEDASRPGTSEGEKKEGMTA